MANQTVENMNVPIINVNNNITDNNVGLDNTGTIGNNTTPTINMPEPSDYNDGATASSSSMPPRLEDDQPPPQNYQPV